MNLKSFSRINICCLWLLVTSGVVYLNAESVNASALIASGDTTQTTSILWGQSSNAGNLTFEYSTDPNFATATETITRTVTNPLIPAKVFLTNLTPQTNYFYRVTDSSGIASMGQFKTSANPGKLTGFRLGVSGDWRGELSPYPAVQNVPSRNLGVFVELGDTIYSDYVSPILPGVNQAITLDEFRQKHQEVYTEKLGLNTLGALRASTSILATIDDHEVTNDFQGGQDLSTASTAEQNLFGASNGLVNDSPLYENGLQAFSEYNPLRNEVYGNTGDARTAGEPKLYRFNTYGNDAAILILDARSFRDEGLPGVTNPNDPTQVGNFLTQSFNPNRTLLGKQQLEDFKQDLLKAQQDGITWKFVMIPEPIQNLGVFGASDRFEGYSAERTEILKFIKDNNINNVVFVTADIHGTVVNNLTYQTSAFGPQIATNAFEISTGSVAFDAPFGPTVADLGVLAGLLTPQQKAFFNSLPIANDQDNTINDRDDFIKSVVNSGLTPLGYDPVGLNNNLPVANGLIDATLLQGDYIATQTYGWTEFDIDKLTQQLRVITYGILPYTEAELNSNPNTIINRTPFIVSEFVVNPKNFSPASVPESSSILGLVILVGLGSLTRIKKK